MVGVELLCSRKDKLLHALQMLNLTSSFITQTQTHEKFTNMWINVYGVIILNNTVHAVFSDSVRPARVIFEAYNNVDNG